MSLLRRVLLLALFLFPTTSLAVPWVFKHDQFPSDLSSAANTINGGQFYVQPGFVAGEAFGQIYTPLPEMYPLQIKGFDVVLAAPPYATETLFTNATIEVYNSESQTADPGNAPIYSITTSDLLDPKTQQFGFPLQGNVGIHVEFDLSNADDRPPVITSGKVWLVIRINDDARDMSMEWGTLQCTVIDIGGLGSVGCGCQNVGTVHDATIVPKVNVLHHVIPLGQCSGNKQWSYMENISNGTFAINGDIILRLHADVAAEPCIPDCEGLQCGSDGCGGTCGNCQNGRFCVEGECVTCQPNCLSRQCGEDGCGGSCGTCAEGQICGDDYFCKAPCTPDCADKECGSDGCGGTCGTCTTGTCVAGQCETACVPDCADKECGPDGCGNSCGTCGADTACVDGVCEAPQTCTPNCNGKTCGDDGCGHTCGTCEGGETCTAGACVGSFEVTDISPDFGPTSSSTLVSITGRGFVDGAKVKLGGTNLQSVVFTGSSLIEATVPSGLAPGRYNVIVVNPDGALAQLVDGFEIRGASTDIPASGTDSGCTSGRFELVALALFGLMVLRRRTA